MTRFAVRGSPADFDAWATIGNPGWSFEDVLPAFIALETDLDFGDRPWHGNAGPISIGRYLHLKPTEIAAATLAAMETSGFPHVEDHNRPGAVGAGPMPMSSRDGVRVTTADAYLPRVGAPSNLTIMPDAHVAEVVLEDVRATGVRLSDGSIVEAGWVVLSSGTYGSPPILLRSGIGPPITCVRWASPCASSCRGSVRTSRIIRASTWISASSEPRRTLRSCMRSRRSTAPARPPTTHPI